MRELDGALRQSLRPLGERRRPVPVAAPPEKRALERRAEHDDLAEQDQRRADHRPAAPKVALQERGHRQRNHRRQHRRIGGARRADARHQREISEEAEHRADRREIDQPAEIGGGQRRLERQAARRDGGGEDRRPPGHRARDGVGQVAGGSRRRLRDEIAERKAVGAGGRKRDAQQRGARRGRRSELVGEQAGDAERAEDRAGDRVAFGRTPRKSHRLTTLNAGATENTTATTPLGAESLGVVEAEEVAAEQHDPERQRTTVAAKRRALQPSGRESPTHITAAASRSARKLTSPAASGRAAT